jgi:6-phosphogluconolactonase (cycloisomerase 2 family)
MADPDSHRDAGPKRGGPGRPGAGANGLRCFAYTGCFTTEKRRARGDGIHVFRIDAATARWTPVQHVGDLVNPSWLFTNRDRTVLYSLHGDQDYATSFSIDPASGRLSLLNRAATGGVNGVSGKLDRSGRFLVVANYGSGNVAVLPVAADGSLREPVQVVALPGEPHPRHRVYHQERSHPHDIMFDPTGRCVAVPDKGLDRTFLFRFDQRTGRLTPHGAGCMPSRVGAGPRHAVFHPARPVAWVLNELDSTVSTCAWNAARGTLTPVDVVSTLPGDFVGENLASEIAFVPGSATLYVSNRGHDSIARFRVSRTDGRPRALGWQPTGGAKPRFLAIDPAGRVLYAANEAGHSITRFRLEPRSGALIPFGRAIPVASPAAIAFATAPARPRPPRQ